MRERRDNEDIFFSMLYVVFCIKNISLPCLYNIDIILYRVNMFLQGVKTY